MFNNNIKMGAIAAGKLHLSPTHPGCTGCCPFLGGDSVVVYSLFVVTLNVCCCFLCWAFVLCNGSWCTFWLSNHLAEKENAGSFTLIVSAF